MDFQQVTEFTLRGVRGCGLESTSKHFGTLILTTSKGFVWTFKGPTLGKVHIEETTLGCSTTLLSCTADLREIFHLLNTVCQCQYSCISMALIPPIMLAIDIMDSGGLRGVPRVPWNPFFY